MNLKYTRYTLGSDKNVGMRVMGAFTKHTVYLFAGLYFLQNVFQQCSGVKRFAIKERINQENIMTKERKWAPRIWNLQEMPIRNIPCSNVQWHVFLPIVN